MTEKNIEAIRKFLKKLEGAESADSALQFLVEAASELLGAEKVSVVSDSDSGLLQVRALSWPGTDTNSGISGRVYSTGESLLVSDIRSDHRLKGMSSSHYRSSSFISVPILSNGNSFAVLNITDREDGSVFSGDDLGLAELLADVASIGLERHRFMESIEELQKESVTDSLTGLGNRRHFERRMLSEVSRARRFGQPLSLIMLDIDDFKVYNDTYGHPVGDTTLSGLAQIMLDNVRAIDDVIRYGGEEFAVILPQTRIDMATVVAERIRAAANELKIEGIEETTNEKFSVSIGVASFPIDARDEHELVNHADIALYIAKSEGKDRVVVFEQMKEDERRIYRRIPIRLSTIISGEDHRGPFEEQTITRNLSASGALIVHRRAMDIDVPIHLSIQNPILGGEEEQTVMKVEGKLVRLEQGVEELRGAIAFNTILNRFS